MMRAKLEDNEGFAMGQSKRGEAMKKRTMPSGSRTRRTVRFATNNFGVEFDKEAPPCHISLAGLQDPFNATAQRGDLRFNFQEPKTLPVLWPVAERNARDGVKAVNIDYRANFRHYDVESLSHRFKYFLESVYRFSCGLRVDLLRYQCTELKLGVVFRTFPAVAPKRSLLGPHESVVYLEGFGWLRDQLSGENHAGARLWLNLIFVYAHDLWAKSETEKRLNEDEYNASTWVEDYMEIRNDVGPPFVIRRLRQLGGGTGQLGHDKNSRPANYRYEVRW